MEFDWAKLQKDNKPGALDTSLESVNGCFRTEMLLLRVVFPPAWAPASMGYQSTFEYLQIEYLHVPMMHVLITLVIVVGLKAMWWGLVGMPDLENK